MGNFNSQQVIIIFLLICGLMLVWSLWKKQLITVIIKFIIGIGILWIINIFLPTIAIGINFLTIGIVGILGIPGIIMLYIIQGLL